MAKKQDGVAVGQYYQDPIDIELQKLKSSQALKEKFKKIKRGGRFLSYEKKVSVPYLHDLAKTERDKGAFKYKYLYGEGFNASTGPDMEAYKLFGTDGDYPTQPTGIGSSEEIANGSEVISTKNLNEEGYFNGALDSHKKNKSQKGHQSKHRLGPIVKDDSVGPGSYDLNFNKSAGRGHTQSFNDGLGLGGFSSSSLRFYDSASEKNRQNYSSLGPGAYEPDKTVGKLYKFKPSSSFLDQTPKDILAFELNQKISKVFRTKKPKASQEHKKMLMTDLRGKKSGPTTFSNISPYQDIEIDEYGRAEPGPGDYDLRKFSDFASKINQKKISNLGFNSVCSRWDPKNTNYKPGNVGPGHYPELRGFDRQNNAAEIQDKGYTPADHNFSRKKRYPNHFNALSTHAKDLKWLKEKIYNGNPPGPGYYQEKPRVSDLLGKRRHTQGLICPGAPRWDEPSSHQ